MSTEKKISLKMRIISLFAIIILLGIDQLIKYYVDIYLKDSAPFVAIEKILQFNYVPNDGGPLGLFEGKTKLMTVLAIVCVVVMLVVIFSGLIKNRIDYWCCLLMIAGGLGNIIDRVFRGYVIDYIEVLFIDFYIFNFADCLITCSAFFLIFYQIYLIYKENKTKKAGENH